MLWPLGTFFAASRIFKNGPYYQHNVSFVCNPNMRSPSQQSWSTPIRMHIRTTGMYIVIQSAEQKLTVQWCQCFMRLPLTKTTETFYSKRQRCEIINWRPRLVNNRRSRKRTESHQMTKPTIPVQLDAIVQTSARFAVYEHERRIIRLEDLAYSNCPNRWRSWAIDTQRRGYFIS